MRQEAEVAKLVTAGFPLLRLPALADPHAVLVRQTVRTCGYVVMYLVWSVVMHSLRASAVDEVRS